MPFGYFVNLPRIYHHIACRMRCKKFEVKKPKSKMYFAFLLTTKANRRMSTSLKSSLSLANRAKLSKLNQVVVATVSANALTIGNASSSPEMFHTLRAHNFSRLSVTQRAMTNESQHICFPIPLNDIDGRVRVSVVGAHCHRWIPVHPITVVCFQRDHCRMHLISLPLAARNFHDANCKSTNDRLPKQSAQVKRERCGSVSLSVTRKIRISAVRFLSPKGDNDSCGWCNSIETHSSPFDDVSTLIENQCEAMHIRLIQFAESFPHFAMERRALGVASNVIPSHHASRAPAADGKSVIVKTCAAVSNDIDATTRICFAPFSQFRRLLHRKCGCDFFGTPKFTLPTMEDRATTIVCNKQKYNWIYPWRYGRAHRTETDRDWNVRVDAAALAQNHNGTVPKGWGTG